MKVAEEEGVDFVLNARTDAFSLNRKGDPAENLQVAIERGKAYLDAGAPVVFVPAILTEAMVLQTRRRPRAAEKTTTIGIPGNPPRDWQQEHGVARTSYGPLSLERRPHRAPGAGRGGAPRRRGAADDAPPRLKRGAPGRQVS